MFGCLYLSTVIARNLVFLRHGVQFRLHKPKSILVEFPSLIVGQLRGELNAANVNFRGVSRVRGGGESWGAHEPLPPSLSKHPTTSGENDMTIW